MDAQFAPAMVAVGNAAKHDSIRCYAVVSGYKFRVSDHVCYRGWAMGSVLGTGDE